MRNFHGIFVLNHRVDRPRHRLDVAAQSPRLDAQAPAPAVAPRSKLEAITKWSGDAYDEFGLPSVVDGLQALEDLDPLVEAQKGVNNSAIQTAALYRNIHDALDAKGDRDAAAARHRENAGVRDERTKKFDAAENKQQFPSPKSTRSPLAYPDHWLISTQAVRL